HKRRQVVNERKQVRMTKVLEAMTSVQASEIDFWVTNLLNEQNGEARRWKMHCHSLKPITSVPVQDEELDLKRSPIDKILQCEKALAIYNFQKLKGILAHMCEQQEANLAIDSRRVTHVRSTHNRDERRSEQRYNRNYQFVVLNPTAAIGKSQDQKFRQLAPSAIWKQTIRPMLDKNDKLVLERNQQTQIIHNNKKPLNSILRGQPPK
ncbi:MAG: hypothetical protein EZS28_024430, partial [Streblomastix strix]